MDNVKSKGVFSRVPRTSWIVLILLWMCYAMNGGCREVMNKVLPAMVEDLNMSPTTSGLISTCGTLGAGLLAAILGSWADKRGLGYKRKKTQIIIWAGYLLLTMCFGIPAITSSIAVMFVLQFFRFGFAGGGEIVDLSTGSEWWPNEAKGFIFSAVHTGYPWGTFLISLFVAFVLERTGSWRSLFLIIPLIAIVPTILYMLYTTRGRFLRNNQEMLARGLTPSVTEADLNGIQKAGEAAEEKKSSSLSLMKNPNVTACVVCYVCIVGAYFGLNYWLTPYMSYIGNMSVSSAAIFSSIFAVTAGLGQIFWGYFSDKIGCKRTILICVAWLFICFLLLPLVNKGTGFCIVIQLLMGFCTNASFPVINNFCGRSVKSNQLASALGLCAASMLIGGLVPYLLSVFISAGGGWYAEQGYNVSLIFMCACLAVGFLVILLFSHEVIGPKRGKDWALTSYAACGIEKADQ